MSDRLESRPQGAMKLWPRVMLRAYTGLYFFWHGISKIARGDFVEGMTGFLNGNLENAGTFYRTFIELVVLPNKGLFAGLVAWGELAIGIALFLGLATRYAAFSGAFMMLNFWLAKGGGVFTGASADFVWIIIFLALGFIPAGRVAGLDDGLSDRLPFLR